MVLIDLLAQPVQVISEQHDPVSTVGFLETWLLRLPSGTPIQAEDTVIVGGLSYSVSGEPRHMFNPRLGIDHIEVPVDMALVETPKP